MKRYVLGFAFNEERNKVLLIRKNRPDWQAGKFNGIGGHIDDAYINPAFEMMREFEEEAGVRIQYDEWYYIANLTGPDFKLHVYSTVLNKDEETKIRSMTDETVMWVHLSGLYHTPVASKNVQTFIALALDNSGITKPVFLTES